MRKKKSRVICSHCYQDLKSKFNPFLVILESIVEIFLSLEQPVPIEGDDHSYPFLEYLEKGRYIVTTEFTDPDIEEVEIVLVLPLGKFKSKNDSSYFCFDAVNHE